MKTGNQKRKYACNRYEDITKQCNKVLDKFGDDENVQILMYWINKLQKERATFRKKAVKYDELQSILEEYNVTPEILREVLLTGQMFRNQPTFDECIKEWEDRGYRCVFSNEDSLLEIFNDEDYSVIKIGMKNKHYIKVDSVIYAIFESITFEEHFLLTKTLKALEELNQ